MKFYGGMYYPDDEQHMIDWCEKHGVSMFGRTAYQGKKQLQTIEQCKKLGRLGVAVDIGAHIGHWSMTLAHHFETVMAFEPVAEHRECFAMNLDPKACDNVVMIECALGHREGRVVIKREKGNSGNSSVMPLAADPDGEDSVPLKTLDSFNLQPDLIKIDTEGFEVQVLRGAERTIVTCRPVVVVEQKRDMGAKYGNKPQAAVELLKSWGYHVVADMGGDFLCVHPGDAS